MTTTQFITVKQAADSLGVHPFTVRRWIADGHLRAVRVGPRNIRVNPDDIAAMTTPIGKAE